jgi:hypothetical protein
VDRPLDQCVRSLAKLKNWGWPAEPIEPTLRRLVETRDRDLGTLPPERVLRIDYRDIVRDPAAAAQRLAVFAGVTPAPEVLAAAVAWVDPQLWTVRPAPPQPDTERRPIG